LVAFATAVTKNKRENDNMSQKKTENDQRKSKSTLGTATWKFTPVIATPADSNLAWICTMPGFVAET